MARKRAAGKRARRRGASPAQLPWARVDLAFPPLELISADQAEAIHRASLEVLRKTGIEVLSERVLGLLQRAGVAVDRGDGARERDLEAVARGLRRTAYRPGHPGGAG